MARYVAPMFAVAVLWTSSHAFTPVVNELQSFLNANTTLRQAVADSIVVGGHGPNSTQPWTVEHVVERFQSYSLYLPTYEHPFYWVEAMQVMLNQPCWSTLPLSGWLHDFTVWRGAFLSQAASTRVIPEWLNNTDFNQSMEDFVVPLGGFKSFSDFFLRELRPGVRPVSSPQDNTLAVSPVDGFVWSIWESVTLQTQLHLKRGTHLDLAAILGDQSMAQRFVGGSAINLIVAGNNYHQWHAPVGDRVAGTRLIGGLTFQDSDGLGYYHTFHRGVLYFQSAEGGLVAFVPIGLAEVGSVILRVREGDAIQKGQKVGNFAFGGSSTLLIFDNAHHAQFVVDSQQTVKVGEPIAKLTAKMIV